MTRSLTLALLSTAVLAATPVFAEDTSPGAGPEGGRPAVTAEQKAQMWATREKIKASMEAVREKNKAVMEKIRTLKQEARTLLQAEPFDRSAFLAKHSEIDKLMSEMHRARAEAMADLAASLTPQERQMLGQRPGGKGGMRDGSRGEGPHDGGGRGDKGGPMSPPLGAEDEGPGEDH